MAEERDEEVARLKARLAELEAGKVTPSRSSFRSGFVGTFGALAAVGVIVAVVAAIGSQPVSSTVATDTPAAPPPLPVGWRYTTAADPMSSKDVRIACITSSNEIHLDSPYQPQRPELCVRRHPRWGTDAYVQLPLGGQFLCYVSDCTVSIRFDDAPARSFRANEPEDGSSDTLFVADDSRLIAGLRSAEVVLLAANFFQNGNQSMSFPVKDFDASRLGIPATVAAAPNGSPRPKARQMTAEEREMAERMGH